MSRYESAPGDRGVYFDIAHDVPCEVCGKKIREGRDAMYDTEDGLLVGRCCGPR